MLALLIGSQKLLQEIKMFCASFYTGFLMAYHTGLLVPIRTYNMIIADIKGRAPVHLGTSEILCPNQRKREKVAG